MSSEMDRYWYIGYKNDIKLCYNHSDRYVDTDVTKQREAIGNRFENFEDAKEALEKLKAWKRLEDKGFRFIGKTYETDKRFGSIFYKVDEDTYSEDIIDDLDILFGGEE